MNSEQRRLFSSPAMAPPRPPLSRKGGACTERRVENNTGVSSLSGVVLRDEEVNSRALGHRHSGGIAKDKVPVTGEGKLRRQTLEPLRLSVWR